MAKFATVIASAQGIEVGTISILLLVIAAWTASFGMFALVAVFQNVIFSAVSLIAGAVLGIFIVVKMYPGKLLYRFSYDEITSFVGSEQEFTINTKESKTYSVRMSKIKQQKLLLGICDIFESENRYVFKRSGKHFRIEPNTIDKTKTE